MGESRSKWGKGREQIEKFSLPPPPLALVTPLPFSSPAIASASLRSLEDAWRRAVAVLVRRLTLARWSWERIGSRVGGGRGRLTDPVQREELEEKLSSGRESISAEKKKSG